jgi:putative DNA primase/helicase
MDLLAGFIEQCVEIDYTDDNKIMASDLFRVYSKWSKDNHEYEMSSKKFFREISNKIPEKGRNSSGIYYKNIRLTEYANDLIKTKQTRQYSIDDFT